MPATFTCGTHTAFVYSRGGTVLIGELTPLTIVRWRRIRDDTSFASVDVPTTECCDLLDDLRTGLHELHIFREGVRVWQGPITRLEYDYSVVTVHAEDVLWVAKRTVLQVGYNHAYPNVGDAIVRVDWLLRNQCFALNGDPWGVVPYLHPLSHAGNPKTTRQTFAYSLYVWEDVDKFAEDGGVDYTVVNRDVYYFDTHLAWATLPALDEQWMSQFPRIVEYGYELATRGFYTNGKGYAGSAINLQGLSAPHLYGYIDHLIVAPSELAETDAPPNAGQLTEWTKAAARNISGKAPAPVAIVIPANTTLLPGAPWTIEQMIPGAWFPCTVTRMCRTVNSWQRLHEVVVEESAPDGEKINFSAVTAPVERVNP